MIAVIQTGGKQYVVTEDQQLHIEKLEVEVGKPVVFTEVLMISDEEGNSFDLGMPTVSPKTVEAEVVEQGRERKIRVVKYKNKTRYHKVYGHRQHFTKIRITSIAGSTIAPKVKKAAKVEKVEKAEKAAKAE